MLANYTPTRRVKPCQPVFIPLGISMKRQVYSHFDKTRRVILKIWSCPTVNEQEHIAKLRASTQQADKIKLTAPVSRAVVLTATLHLKPWVATITFASVEEYYISH